MDMKTVNDAVNTLQIPTKEVSTNLTVRPSKEVGEGLSDIFWLVFSPFRAARAALEPRIDRYKQQIEKETSKILSDQLVEPQLSIVGPALEASKFYIEHDEIRELFAKLIASSMDAEKQETIHPSFVETIKQLSPFDARVLKQLIDNPLLPVGKAILEEEDNLPKKRVHFPPFREVYSEVIAFPELSLENCHLYISSIQNLRRLSIIKIDYDLQYTETDRYKSFDNFFNEFKSEYSDSEKHPQHENYIPKMKNGIWMFTTFGYNFIETCCYTDKGLG